MSLPLLMLAGWVAFVITATVLRNRVFAIFAGVMSGVYALVITALLPQLGGLGPAFVAGLAVLFLHFSSLIRPKMRPTVWRLLVSWPALTLLAFGLLATPWAIAAGVGHPLPGLFVPAVLALIGAFQSSRSPSREVQLHLDGADVGDAVVRLRPPSRDDAGSPLRIVQITDPHLGPWMSVSRLRRICADAVAADPDLVLLTGDYMTMESQSDPSQLTEALSPLADLPGRVYACLGNHDHEALVTVQHAMRENGIGLLVDQATDVDTPVGRVQIVGFDFHFRERAAQTQRVMESLPESDAPMRIALLHDPGAFKHLPPRTFDLVLSGHTHGGQFGFVSLGGNWTPVWSLVGMPDHGLFGRDTSRLYVHRGTGLYGFPIRLGVPGEEGVLAVTRA